MALLSRRRDWPEGLSMTVDDTFFVVLANQGTVLTGQLAGEGLLRVGDVMVHARGETPVRGLKGFKKEYREAGPGMNIGLVLGLEVPPDGFKGETVRFRRG